MNVQMIFYNHRKIAALIGVVSAAAVGVVCWKSVAAEPIADRLAQNAFYSDDDGKTWFADAASKISPIDRNGKPAYRVHVFQVGTAAPAVAYMEMYEPSVKKKLEQTLGGFNPFIVNAASREMMIKRPGDKNWLKPAAHDYDKVIMSVPRDASPITPD